MTLASQEWPAVPGEDPARQAALEAEWRARLTSERRTPVKRASRLPRARHFVAFVAGMCALPLGYFRSLEEAHKTNPDQHDFGDIALGLTNFATAVAGGIVSVMVAVAAVYGASVLLTRRRR